MFSYDTMGVCSKKIEYDIIDGKVYNVCFTYGCKGNLAGIGALVEGQNVFDVISKLSGIKCRGNTSCPDQLAKALERHLK